MFEKTLNSETDEENAQMEEISQSTSHNSSQTSANITDFSRNNDNQLSVTQNPSYRVILHEEFEEEEDSCLPHLQQQYLQPNHLILILLMKKSISIQE